MILFSLKQYPPSLILLGCVCVFGGGVSYSNQIISLQLEGGSKTPKYEDSTNSRMIIGSWAELAQLEEC